MTEPIDEPFLEEDFSPSNSDFDERVQFFLRHRLVIQEWASIGSDARAASNAWLRKIEPDLHPIAGELECRYTAWSTNAGLYNAFFLHSPEAVFTDAGVPVLGCCLGWNSARVYIDGVGGYTPFVGVWVAKSDARGKLWREMFLRDARPVRETHGYLGSPDWPVWKPVPGGEEWWTSLDSYRDRLVQATRELLERFQPLVQATISNQPVDVS
jgi:hypothetical protein